ncbi:MAG: choice-of-anchor D domain-containing protein, partial [Verrucomicrobia bacterium]|nr:choice-of-anchor D domain-containing protein [Verrucomicrobiota bacterium]
DSTTFVVAFTPSATGTREAVLHIASSDTTSNPFLINLTGTGTAPVIVVEQPLGTPLASGTSTVDFGSGLTGEALPLTFTIRNTGSAPLTSILLGTDGDNAADYAVTTALLHIASSDTPSNPFLINLPGTGTAPVIVVEQPLGTPLASGTSTVDFGSGLTGEARPLTFTIRNTGSAPLTSILLSTDGANVADYEVTAAPTTTVAAEDSTTFVVTFTPSATGTREAVLCIASNDTSSNPFSIKLIGTAPLIAVEQVLGTGLISGSGTVDFGSCLTGEAMPLTFTIRNIGSAELTSIAVGMEGAHAADYVVTAAPATSVVSGDSTSFTVTFTPSATGTRAAALHIASDDMANNPFNINLTGTGLTAFQEWASASGLPTEQTDPGQAPQGDGVPNLLKFAFNLDPTQADVRKLSVGADEMAGLPGETWVDGVLRIEFIRRKACTNPGITYTPQFSSSVDLWTDFTGTPVVTSIDSTWERVVIEDAPPVGSTQRFGHLKVVTIP